MLDNNTPPPLPDPIGWVLFLVESFDGRNDFLSVGSGDVGLGALGRGSDDDTLMVLVRELWCLSLVLSRL